jgi:2-dehydro-3-deoxy-D-arabinonate dehydratase
MSAPTVHLRLLRVRHSVMGERLGIYVGDDPGAPLRDVTRRVGSLEAWLLGSVGRVALALADLYAAADDAPTLNPAEVTLLPPVDTQEVWAAGVTYLRSRAARQEEAVDGGDVYARVYEAARPELFFKAHARQVVAHGDAVGIRRDATWNVPEPELALLVNPAMEIVGYTLGNDMSSRDIEGENPLYLPQAKIYNRSCALGPALVLNPLRDGWPDVTIRLTITRAGRQLFAGETHTRHLRRSPTELVEHLGRCLDFPQGALLLTGTGVVPGDDFTLAAGDRIQIDGDGIGSLANPVVVV